LDGIPIRESDRDQIGPYLGFLPQNADLFPGTIAQNIARFGEADEEKLLQATTITGARDMISRLPQGFDTDVGEAGQLLSAGQRRRVALARAVYGWPVMLCLDEPEAHLDADGESGLTKTILALKERGACVIIAAHRPSVITAADKILILTEGKMKDFGPAEKLLPQILPPGTSVLKRPPAQQPAQAPQPAQPYQAPQTQAPVTRVQFTPPSPGTTKTDKS
jgi:ABC-type protease/lipase transport system fused ATPase/permease subunit